MNKYNLLECTLRDGGYITSWQFEDRMISETVKALIDARLDYIEVGYLNNQIDTSNTTRFKSIDGIAEFLPKDRKKSVILVMADVQQFLPENLTPYDGRSVNGIRVVFYKHQIEEALKMAKAVKDNGYLLLMQPMVTIDYSIDEYVDLSNKIAALDPYAVSIVDSFGYMTKSDFRNYFRVLDNVMPKNVSIGFHSHNNMNLSLITAQDILEYQTPRQLIVDASLYGMGRGAGNLQTELIANYYNMMFGVKYDLNIILNLISDYILPIYKKSTWGYSPYYLLTALCHCHPNYAGYLLQEHDVSVSEFQKFLKTIPKDMYTKCKKEYVLNMYKDFKERNDEPNH